MSHHFYLPFISLFSTFVTLAVALSHRYPSLLRPFGVVMGLFLVAMGIALPQYFHGLTAPAIFRWAAIASGALLALGGALNWLSIVQDEAPLRPATGRPLHHFGEAP